ncbi:MAG: proline--tRNA ligase [Oceanococcaceae bacterium]
MRLTQFPLITSKDVPADAEIPSHQLMLRSGMIRRIAAGIYTWSPLGLRVLRKVEAIVREEMNAAGALEVLMPAVQPAELWQESGRWEQMGPLMLRLQDRHGREYCFGPTHEEVITTFMRSELKSYRQLPLNFYQIQMKFRDETRPRFGVMRSREFLMKDAYSFHRDAACLEQTYQAMRAAYTRIFTRIGVDFRIVRADSGDIGGSASEEFHVLANSGEDLLAISSTGEYAANVEAAQCTAALSARPAPGAPLATVATPRAHSISEVAAQLQVAPQQCAKTLIVKHGDHGALAAIVLRGDHSLNEIKAAGTLGAPLEMAGEDEVRRAAGCGPGSVGPVGLSVPVYVDRDASVLADFVCGANTDGAHLTGVNWGRDLPEGTVADLRNIEAGDIAPDGGTVELKRGIEAGHIFQLGLKYSQAMKLNVPDENGEALTPTMGCYGIGVTRIVGAVIEQSHDADGIIWPAAIAPFDVVIVGLNPKNDPAVASAIDELYNGLRAAGVEVLLDDRDLRPGHRFADADLVGIPHRIVAGARGFATQELEYKRRGTDNVESLAWSVEAVRTRVVAE